MQTLINVIEELRVEHYADQSEMHRTEECNCKYSDGVAHTEFSEFFAELVK